MPKAANETAQHLTVVIVITVAAARAVRAAAAACVVAAAVACTIDATIPQRIDVPRNAVAGIPGARVRLPADSVGKPLIEAVAVGVQVAENLRADRCGVWRT